MRIALPSESCSSAASIAFVGNRDPTTRRLVEGILSAEERHAEDLATLMLVNGE